MLLKPLNEFSLWRGKLQAGQKPVEKPPMNLPKIIDGIGGTVRPSKPIWQEILKEGDALSQAYWEGLKKRQQEYRLRETLKAYNRINGITPPYQ
jgi:hypothetical protein